MNDEPPTDEQYREKARALADVGVFDRHSDIEIDEDARVERMHNHRPEDSARCHNADEDGAYVQAWVWVPVDDAGKLGEESDPCPCGRPGPVLHMAGEKCCQ